MTFRTSLAMLLCAGSLTAAEEIELTGLADFSGCRIACVQLGSGGPTATLHLGESAFGFTFKDLDTKAGWARFQRNTNEICIRLNSAPASAPSSVAAAVGLRLTNAGSGPISFEAFSDQSTLPQVGVPLRVAEQNEISSPFAAFVAGSPPGAAASAGVPKTTQNPAEPSARSTAPENSGSQQNTVTQPTVVESDPAVGAHSDTLTAPTSAPGQVPPAARAPQALSEGDRIRLFYGTQAYLAWDLAQGFRRSQ